MLQSLQSQDTAPPPPNSNLDYLRSMGHCIWIADLSPSLDEDTLPPVPQPCPQPPQGPASGPPQCVAQAPQGRALAPGLQGWMVQLLPLGM